MIEVGQKIMSLLESQVVHYQSMKQAIEKQSAAAADHQGS